MDAELKKKIVDVFYGGKRGFLFPSAQKLYHALMREKVNVSYGDVQKWHQNQTVTQIMSPKPFRKSLTYFPIIGFYPFQRVYVDTMYIPEIGYSFVNAIDLFSKFAFSRLHRNYETSLSAVKALTAIRHIFDDIRRMGHEPPDAVYCDNGGEFRSVFANWVEEHSDLKRSVPNDRVKNPPVERFNKTVRSYIARWRATNKQPMSQFVLDRIVDAYNNTAHSTLMAGRYTPNDVLTDKKAEEALVLFNRQRYADALEEYEKNELEKGDSVRVMLDHPFGKTGQVWSNDIHKITDFDRTTQHYVLDNGQSKRREQLFYVDLDKLKEYDTPLSQEAFRRLANEKRPRFTEQRRKRELRNLLPIDDGLAPRARLPAGTFAGAGLLNQNSNPEAVYSRARELLGSHVVIKPSSRRHNKYMVSKDNGNTWIHFGASAYQDFTKHHDEHRRRLFRARNRTWANAPTWTPRWMAYHLLW